MIEEVVAESLIWIVAEERSGSTWLSTSIAERLGLTYSFTDELRRARGHVYHTHEFELLQHIADAVVLRVCRRSRYEQFLSYVFMVRRLTDHPEMWKTPHLEVHPLETFDERRAAFDKLVLLAPIEVGKDEVREFLDLKARRERLWQEFDQPKRTIYYEDLRESVALPELSIASLSFRDGGGYAKLPYNKEQVVLNAMQVRQWLTERPA